MKTITKQEFLNVLEAVAMNPPDFFKDDPMWVEYAIDARGD